MGAGLHGGFGNTNGYKEAFAGTTKLVNIGYGNEFGKYALKAKPEKGFAQHLANKMHVPVKAPTDIIWAHPNGVLSIGPHMYSNTGTWKMFYPKKIV